MFWKKYRLMEEAGDGGEGGAGTGEGGDGGGAPAWVDTLDNDMKGYVANKGWKEPTDVLSSYQNLEKMVGASPDKLVRIPGEDAAQDEWDQYFAKLGRPDSPDQYEFPKGEHVDENFQKAMAETLHKAGVPDGMAKQLMEGYDEYMAQMQEQARQDWNAKQTEEQRQLEQEWGAAKEKNERIAAKGAQAMGLEPEVLEAMEDQLGYAGVMKAFHKIGTKISEDAYEGDPGDGGGGGFNAMTPAQAQQKIAELKSDEKFRTRYMGGDPAAQRQMDELHRMAYPGRK